MFNVSVLNLMIIIYLFLASVYASSIFLNRAQTRGLNTGPKFQSRDFGIDKIQSGISLGIRDLVFYLFRIYCCVFKTNYDFILSTRQIWISWPILGYCLHQNVMIYNVMIFYLHMLTWNKTTKLKKTQ